MKLSTVLAVLCATEASAASLLQKFTGGSSQVVLHEGPDLKVPGESPLQYCGPTDDHILTIEKVDLLPNPPKAGITLTIEASGSTSDVIAAGSMVDVVVKYGKYVTILNQSFDLCDNVNQVDQECPIDQGRYVLSKSVDIPSGVPAGTYNVQALAYTGDGRPITCLTASIVFDA